MPIQNLSVRRRKNHLRQIIAGVQLCLFLSIQANNVLFQHIHRFANGTVLVHAHPFSKNTTHKHTKSEYIILDAVFHAVFLPAVVFSPLEVFEREWPIVWHREIFTISVGRLFNSFLRGPPQL